MNRAFNRQCGMSFPVILILVALAAFAGLFGVKVGPTYFEYMTVKKIAEDTAANTEVMSQPRSKVLTYINKAYRTNNLWDIRAEDTIVLQKDGRKGYTVNVEYEKRSPLFANIEVVTVFKKTAGTP